LEGEVRRLAARYLDALRDEPRFDVQQAFSVKFPMDVISALLGIPEQEREWYRHTVDKGLERDPETGMPGRENITMFLKARELILSLLAARRKEPRDDLITGIAHADYTEANGTRRPLSDDEVAAFTSLLAAAGAETTAKLIGNMIVYLSR